MPTIVMKEAPDVDYYVGWSSVVEAPVFSGTRAEVLARLQREADPWLMPDAPHHPARRMERADATGTTSLWVTQANAESPSFAAHGHVEEGCWEDGPRIYMQRGLVSRADIFVLTRRLENDPDADVSDLLAPFDDDENDRAPASSAVPAACAAPSSQPDSGHHEEGAS